MKNKNGLYVYIKSSFRISKVELFWSLFNFRNKFIKQFIISKDRFFKLWQEKIFEGKKSDFRTVMNFYNLETPVLLKFNRFKRFAFILCFLFAKKHIKSYKLFLQNFLKQVNLYIKNTSSFLL